MVEPDSEHHRDDPATGRAHDPPEATLTALAGAVIRTLVGLFLGIAIRALLESIGFATLAIPAASASMFFLLSVIAGVLAAALPARRASRMDVLAAIRGE